MFMKSFIMNKVIKMILINHLPKNFSIIYFPKIGNNIFTNLFFWCHVVKGSIQNQRKCLTYLIKVEEL